MRLTENPILYTTHFAWLELHSHQISADYQWPLGLEGTCGFHITLYLWIRQSFCTSLKGACSEGRLFHTTTVGHRPSASDCQKEKMLWRSSDVPQAIQQLETENKDRECGIEKNCKENRAAFSSHCSTLSREKAKIDALYNLMKYRQDPSKVIFNNCLYYYLSCHTHIKVQQFKIGTKRVKEFRRILYKAWWKTEILERSLVILHLERILTFFATYRIRKESNTRSKKNQN